MVADFGFGALVITFLVSLFGIGAAIYGDRTKNHAWVDSARNAMLLTFPLLTISTVSLIILLVSGRYEYDYVYSVTSNSMPIYLRITALWGGQPGSLLFWSWLLAAFASAVTFRKWKRDREFLPWVIVVCLITLAFFLLLVIFVENPFRQIFLYPSGEAAISMFQPSGTQAFTPSDGRGLNPLLRHPGMIIHPPMLYLGFVAYVIPFAFAIAALITGRTDDRWIRLTRRWTLWAWLFLSLGLVLGMRWAYDVLGWGGYWGWDPVEIAALLPWLSSTPFLHSVMIQEKRGMLKHWNMILIILTYSLMIFGTFLTRSGVLSSVHAFAQSAIGPLFFGFIALTFIISMYLVFYRWKDLKSETRMTSLFSREALFLLNNLLFIAILVTCFWGMIFPLISEIFTGQKITVGPIFYQRATGPLWAGLLLLMGVAPLSAWGHSTIKTLGRALWKPVVGALFVVVVIFVSGTTNWVSLIAFGLIALVIFVTLYEFWRGALARNRSKGEGLPLALWRLTWRNRRRYGGYIIHLSMVLMALGIIGIDLFQTETQGTVPIGGQITLDDYIITYDSLAVWDSHDGRNISRATVTIFKNGVEVGQLNPRRDYYYESQQPSTIPGVRSTWEDDLYILLIDWQPISTQAATFKIYHNPLVNWLWIGSFVFILGILIAAWPDRKVEARQERAAAAYAKAKA